MGKKEYDWHLGDAPPRIDAHSLAKHKVYEEYLAHYIEVLNSNPLIPEFRLTLVDGFAGGGVYTYPNGNSLHVGSPLRLLKSAEAAAAAINVKRKAQGVRIPFNMHAEYFFIEKKQSNFDYLKWYLSQNDMAPRFDNDIHLFHGTFTNRLPSILKYVLATGKKRRCIFVLDQYGYKDVPFHDVTKIFYNLPNAEVILTFATDWLIDYLADTPEYRKALQRIGMESELDISSLLEKKNDGARWRQLVQFELHRSVMALSGAKHYTPFFIVSKEANRSFWLVHLSNHYRARDVMTQLHWRLKNHFAHYGSAGIRMFGYDPSKDVSVTGVSDMFVQTEYSFDRVAEQKTRSQLLVELPEFIDRHDDGILFSDLYAKIANTTPATSDHIKEVALELERLKNIEIHGPGGEKRRNARRISSNDLIVRPKQHYFIF